MVDTYAERSELGWTMREAVGGRGNSLRKAYSPIKNHPFGLKG